MNKLHNILIRRFVTCMWSPCTALPLNLDKLKNHMHATVGLDYAKTSWFAEALPASHAPSASSLVWMRVCRSEICADRNSSSCCCTPSFASSCARAAASDSTRSWRCGGSRWESEGVADWVGSTGGISTSVTHLCNCLYLKFADLVGDGLPVCHKIFQGLLGLPLHVLHLQLLLKPLPVTDGNSIGNWANEIAP